ncbi:MAG: macrolide ABC transporter ATP-binding protein, partial [Acidobacteria bacterium]
MGSLVEATLLSEAVRPPERVVIRSEDLWKTYDMGAVAVHALSGVSFDIERGDYVAI